MAVVRSILTLFKAEMLDRFAPQQYGCFREKKIFRAQKGSNIGIVQYTH
jgi:hypothetical protein